MLKFEELVFRCGFRIDHFPTINVYMFYNCMRLDFKGEMILHILKSVEETFLLALELEVSLRAPLNRRFIFKTRKQCSTCEG